MQEPQSKIEFGNPLCRNRWSKNVIEESARRLLQKGALPRNYERCLRAAIRRNKEIHVKKKKCAKKCGDITERERERERGEREEECVCVTLNDDLENGRGPLFDSTTTTTTSQICSFFLRLRQQHFFFFAFFFFWRFKPDSRLFTGVPHFDFLFYCNAWAWLTTTTKIMNQKIQSFLKSYKFGKSHLGKLQY